MNGATTFTLQMGGALCAVAGGYLLLLLRFRARVFLRRFPDEVRAAVPPLSVRERQFGLLVSLPLLFMLLGFPLATAWLLRTEFGFGGFSGLFLGAYTVWMLFNLFDWLVLDELLLGRLKPGWLILEGAEHLPLRFDRRAHARSFLNGTGGGALVCTAIALLVSHLPV